MFDFVFFTSIMPLCRGLARFTQFITLFDHLLNSVEALERLVRRPRDIQSLVLIIATADSLILQEFVVQVAAPHNVYALLSDACILIKGS